MELHQRAATGFSRTADVYERGRPGYPDAAIEVLRGELGIGPGRAVLDLAAGTGKLTRLLAETGASLVAVEPVAEMRAELSRSLPGIPALAGTAEAIPLRDGSVDAVLAAQAWHWFQGERALAEIHRVLRLGGRLAVLWNAWDHSTEWLCRVSEIVHRHVGDTPQYSTGAWRRAFEQTELFTPLERRSFPHPQEITREVLAARVVSVSYIGALPEDERERVVAEVLELLDGHPETAGRRLLRFSYRTDVYWCTRR